MSGAPKGRAKKQSATRGLPKESLRLQKKDKKKSMSFPNAFVGNPGYYSLLSLGAKKATERNACEIEMCNLKEELR